MRFSRSFYVLAGGLCLLAASHSACAAEKSAPRSPAQAAASIRSVDEAVALALAQAPALRAADARRGASRGERRQAALRPNPELSLQGENFGGSGVYRRTESLETTVGVAQRLELGGKWTARVEFADAGSAVTEREYEATRLDVVRDVTKAYTEAVAARRAVDIEAERLRLADEVLRVARERVQGGKEPLVQARKAEVARSTAALAVDKATRQAEVARRALATLLGVDRVDVVPDHTWFEAVGPEPVTTAGAGRVTANPDYARWDAELARGRAGLNVERAAAVPDVTVGAGVRRFEDTNDTAVILSLTVPIPVLNRNQGAIERAGSELTRTEVEARQARLALEASLADAEERLATAWRDADALRRTIIPTAEQAFGFARDGYAAGKFAFLDVLDAQRTLFDARAQLNDALKELHERRAEVDRLTGRAAATPTGDKP